MSEIKKEGRKREKTEPTTDARGAQAAAQAMNLKLA